MDLSFDRKHRLITIKKKDKVVLRELYRKIRAWEAMPDNMTEVSLVRGAGNVLIAGGLRTVPVITPLGWQISSERPLTISGGYLGAVNANHEVMSPLDCQTACNIDP